MAGRPQRAGPARRWRNADEWQDDDWNTCRDRARGARGRPGNGCAGAGAERAVIPMLVYRTGAYAPNGVPFANGLADYYTLVNERDGGINGVKIVFEECDTGYATDRGVECYER